MALLKRLRSHFVLCVHGKRMVVDTLHPFVTAQLQLINNNLFLIPRYL